MSIRATISKEFSPLFKFANSENPSHIVEKWTNINGEKKAWAIYQNCVRCNKKRFEKKELPEKCLGHTHFCDPCLTEVGKILRKYDPQLNPGLNPDHHKISNEIWEKCDLLSIQ